MATGENSAQMRNFDEAGDPRILPRASFPPDSRRTVEVRPLLSLEA